MRNAEVLINVSMKGLVSNTALRLVHHTQLQPALLAPCDTQMLHNDRCRPNSSVFSGICDGALAGWVPSRPSHPIVAPEKLLPRIAKGPQLVGFCNLVDGLQAPEFAESEADMPEVSGCRCEHSRFRDSAGDGGAAAHSEARAAVKFIIFAR
jgi:hypothetical protein